MTARAGIPVVLALAILAASCGDSSGEPATTEPAVTESVEETTVPDTSSADERADEPTTTSSAHQTSTTPPDREERPVEPPATMPERVPETSVPPVLGEVPADFLAGVTEDATSRTGVAPGDIAVLRAQAVAWNDGSLGCAKPGESYTQAIVLGFWVILDAGGQVLDYRLNDRGQFVLCDAEFARPPGTIAPSS